MDGDQKSKTPTEDWRRPSNCVRDETIIQRFFQWPSKPFRGHLDHGNNLSPWWVIVWRFPWWVIFRVILYILLVVVTIGWGPSFAARMLHRIVK